MEEKLILASVTLVTQKLDRVKHYLVDRYSVNGRLEPADQHALRVIESRKRELQRILLIKTRPAGDTERQKAEAELRMKRRDNGEIFRWRLTSHGYGQLGCHGCEYIYKNTMVGTHGMQIALPVPVKVVINRVCPECGQGVMHSQVVESAQEALGGVEAFWRVCEIATEAGTRPGSTELEESAILMVCEACGRWEMCPCSDF
jgi:hypothetical protein